jgi:hypothetical protein
VPIPAQQAQTASFVERFRAAWAQPTVEALMALLHDDVVLVAPMTARTEGKDEGRRAFERVLTGFPGLRGEVLSWGGTPDALFVELRLSAPVGRRPIEWTVVDRIRLEGEVATERITFMDSGEILRQVLRRPSAWPRMIRLQLAR